MKCPDCKAECIISDWEGWIWVCMICDKDHRRATDEEVEKWEGLTSN